MKTISPLLNTISDFDQKPSSIHKISAVAPSAAPTPSRFDKPFFVPRIDQTTQRTNIAQFDSSGSDLKTSSSQDSRRTQNEAVFENEIKPQVKTTPAPLIVEYQPPFLHPIFNANDTNNAQHLNNVARPPQFPKNPTTTNAPTTTSSAVTNSLDFDRGVTNSLNDVKSPGESEARIRNRPSSVTSSVVNFGDRLQPTANPINSVPVENNLAPVIKGDGKIPELATGLLPPFETLNLYSDTTTQGEFLLQFV